MQRVFYRLQKVLSLPYLPTSKKAGQKQMSDDKTPDYNVDAWGNSASGMGHGGCDKTTQTVFAGGVALNQLTLDALYRSDWLASKICDRPANDATRRWINSDQSVIDALAGLDVQAQSRDGLAWGALYGGAAIVVVVEDGKDTSEPMVFEDVDKVVAVVAADRYNLIAQDIDSDPFSPTYGQPELYQWNGGPFYHHTRIAKFIGTPLTCRDRSAENYWGGSRIDLYYEAVKHLQSAYQETLQTLSESNIGLLKVPNLTQAKAMGGSILDAINKRLTTFNVNKSNFKTAAIDEKESFEFVSRAMTGLREIAELFQTEVSAACEIPELVLFGKSPSGLNASIEEILSIYDDMVSSLQELQLAPAIDKVLGCLYKGDIPEWNFKPLRTPTATQAADNRLKDAQTLQIISEAVAMTPEAAIQFLNDTGNFELKLSMDSEELPDDAAL